MTLPQKLSVDALVISFQPPGTPDPMSTGGALPVLCAGYADKHFLIMTGAGTRWISGTIAWALTVPKPI